MGLTSSEFLLLLPIAILVYYLIPKKHRQYYLLVINLLFYASFGYQYVFVIVVEAFIIWIASFYKDYQTVSNLLNFPMSANKFQAVLNSKADSKTDN